MFTVLALFHRAAVRPSSVSGESHSILRFFVCALTNASPSFRLVKRLEREVESSGDKGGNDQTRVRRR